MVISSWDPNTIPFEAGMIGEICLKTLFQQEATAPFSKILCICALLSPWRHNGNDHRVSQIWRVDLSLLLLFPFLYEYGAPLCGPSGRLSSAMITYGLLTKCEVKMAGYWPSSFFACLWTETKSRSINSQIKNEANIQPSWPHTWSIKDLLYGFWGNFACGIQRVVPSGQDGSVLPARVANHSARFGSSCTLAKLAI